MVLLRNVNKALYSVSFVIDVNCYFYTFAFLNVMNWARTDSFTLLLIWAMGSELKGRDNIPLLLGGKK
jgi:hypothetical protein